MPLLCWFDHFLVSRAEICQIFRWFFGKFKTSKRHSEINWPLGDDLPVLMEKGYLEHRRNIAGWNFWSLIVKAFPDNRYVILASGHLLQLKETFELKVEYVDAFVVQLKGFSHLTNSLFFWYTLLHLLSLKVIRTF